MYNSEHISTTPEDFENMHFRHKSIIDYNQRVKSAKIYHKKPITVAQHRFGIVLRLLLVISFLILFVALFWRTRNSSNPLTFTGFLEFLSGLNSADVNFSVSKFTIEQSWGILNPLRKVFNVVATFLGVIGWLGVNVYNVAMYLIQFIQFLFAG